MDESNYSPDLYALEVVNKNIDVAFNLVMFEQTELVERIQTMCRLQEMVMDNRYYHHIADTFNLELGLSKSAGRLLAAASLFALILTGF